MLLSIDTVFLFSEEKKGWGFLNQTRLKQFRSYSVCSSLQHGTSTGQDRTRSYASKRGSFPRACFQITRLKRQLDVQSHKLLIKRQWFQTPFLSSVPDSLTVSVSLLWSPAGVYVGPSPLADGELHQAA